MKAIMHWRPYLIWTETPFTIYTDHINLLYWKSPCKLNWQTACWHSEPQDYHFTLEHVPGKTHMAADALSWPPGSDEGKQDNQQITMLPEATFIWVADADSDGSLENMITDCQNQYTSTMKEWEDIYPIKSTKTQSLPWHNGPTARHPGQDETVRWINWEYYWPSACSWIQDYVKGCATCQ